MNTTHIPIGSSGGQTSFAIEHLDNVLKHALRYEPSHTALIVFDARCELAKILIQAYRHCLPNAISMNFDEVAPSEVLAVIEALSPDDLVVLIQSTNFRLEAFRFRIELFKRRLKVIEHPHLGRMQGTQVAYYIDALAYDPDYYRTVGNALKQRIDAARFGHIDSGGEMLIFDSPFESAKLNVGDYRDMNNVGGQFPIGEVFTEARDLEAVHGQVRLFAFGDSAFMTNVPERPITLVVRKGRVVDVIDATPAFNQVLENIRTAEGGIWLRELGFGLNRALTRERIVNDVGTFERMCGVHLSLGSKHNVYNKPGIRRTVARYHVDVFAITESVMLDDRVLYRNGEWLT